MSRFVGQHLGGRDDDARRDLEPALELLVRHGGDDARIADEHFGPVLAKCVDDCLHRLRHSEPGRTLASGNQRCRDLAREVQRARGRDSRDSGGTGHAEAEEPAQEHRDPVGELAL